MGIQTEVFHYLDNKLRVKVDSYTTIKLNSLTNIKRVAPISLSFISFSNTEVAIKFHICLIQLDKEVNNWGNKKNANVTLKCFNFKCHKKTYTSNVTRVSHSIIITVIITCARSEKRFLFWR